MNPDLFVLLFVNAETGRVDLGGVFDTRFLADLEARRLCPEGSYWNIIETRVNWPMEIEDGAAAEEFFRPPPIPEDQKCPACGGCGLNEERTTRCSECNGKGTK